jgi:hypothetical protein
MNKHIKQQQAILNKITAILDKCKGEDKEIDKINKQLKK